jgi:FG-GAP-like repeat/Secretion system C-terminal sorting domain
MTRGLFLILLLGNISLRAQFTYNIDQRVPVEIDGKQLSMPWAGGLNAAQVNTMDLNGDNKQDLVIFDRNANRILTYLHENNTYRYAPDYETQFPAEVNQWLLLRDYNCDGKKDVFTSDPFGILVFVNVTAPAGPITWREFNPGFPLLTKGFSGNINLKVNETDIPAIDDVDNDGDLDILNVKFVGIGTVEWHKNLSMERTGTCDSLQLERVTQNYGGFEECSCGRFAFGETCEDMGGRTQHAGGKALLTIDLDSDGDKEIFFSEEECSRVFMLTNTGTIEAPIMNTATAFPSSTPINFLLFPSPYLEDLDFDGKADLVASPNLYSRTYSNINYQRSLWLYKNTGTELNPVFTFTQDNFLQNEMIDLGDFTSPAFGDADGDGDEDLFVGIYAADGFRGSVHYFENVGTNSEASFKYITDDYGFIRLGGFYNVKPQIVDMNGDGKVDLAFTATDLQRGITSLHYLPNNAETGMRVSLAQIITTSFRIGFSENVTVTDINQDGMPDVLVGTYTGALHYYQNTGPVDQFNLVRQNDAYLNIGQSTSRQNLASAVADLDADGRGDLVLADQHGTLSIYGDFRNFNPSISQPATDLFYNSLTQTYGKKKLGLRVQPAIVNLFNSDKPAIVVGNVLGGLYVLRNDEGKELPPDPVITLFPNPVGQNEDLNIKADRNVLLQVYSILGQKMSEPLFIPANQAYPLKLNNLASGLYIAHFTHQGKTFAQKFVVR